MPDVLYHHTLYFQNHMQLPFCHMPLLLKAEKQDEILDKDIEELIKERQEARKAKNFVRADEIRDELLAKGIILKDTREGVKWKRA